MTEAAPTRDRTNRRKLAKEDAKCKGRSAQRKESDMADAKKLKKRVNRLKAQVQALEAENAKLKEALKRGNVEWRAHALQRMLQRGVSRAEVKAVLRANDQIEEYPDDFPFPSALFHGTVDNKVLHVIAALDAPNVRVFIISAYEPDAQHFESDLRTRRRPRK